MLFLIKGGKMFYNRNIESIIEELGSDITGLSSKEASARLQKYGENKLKEGENESVFKLFIESFKDPLVIILLIAAVIQILIGEVVESVIIIAVVLLNAVIGVVQAKKAESSLNALKEMSVPHAKVYRDNEKTNVSSHEVVIGDIVSLEAGDIVPADGRIFESESLKINEGMLTGESVPVEKNTDVIENEVGIGDRVNMAFSSSMIVNGRGKMIVTATGMDSEIGKIANLMENADTNQTPLQQKIDEFGKKLGLYILILSAIIFAIEVYRDIHAGTSNNTKEIIISAFMFAVALAVAAIPEALSSIVTIVLSIGTKIMSEKNAIVRRLPAVETLGSTSVICTDKTGTLTQNKMTVVDNYTLGDQNKKATEDFEGISIPFKNADVMNINFSDMTDKEKLVIIGTLCNDATIADDGTEVGDPTEVALIDFAKSSGLDTKNIRNSLTRISELPFDSDRKLMSTLYKIDGENVMMIKGAPDVVIQNTKYVIENGKSRELTDDDIKKLRNINEMFSELALRVLALGFKKVSEDSLNMDDEKDITLVGFVAMIDPPRESVVHAIKEAREAGIKTVMITGDHKITATAIAKDIGLYEEGDMALSGVELDNMDDVDLYKNIEKISIYARVSPENKIRIVKTWQKKHHVTAMTGDGVNDAPALKQADIGIAMGSGTEVAKDASAMVLVDDNFTSIVNAVEVGRTVYNNIKKSIAYLFAGNLGAIIAIIAAVVFNLPNPFTALQLLFINLVNDSLPAIALGFEGTEEGTMKRKPRPKDEKLLTNEMMREILVRGIIIGAVTIIAQRIGLAKSVNLGVAMSFSTLILSRTLQTLPARSSHHTIFKLGVFSNKVVIGAVVVCLIMFNVILLPSLRPIFTIPMDFGINELMICVGLSVVACALMEISKKIKPSNKEM